MSFRFHIPGIPHTITNKDFIHCAFTQKVYKLCKMLTGLGHEVYHYGCEGSNPECTEHINVIEDEFRKKFYPDRWHDKHWNFDTQDECYKLFFKNTISEIKNRLGNRDFLLCSWGWGHKPIADALDKSVMAVESGIGYKDTFCGFRVFESYNWMSYVYGRGHVDKTGQRISQDDGRHFDAVIPNYFDPNDFLFSPIKEDWFLYLGRIIKRKGVEIAVSAVSNIGGHLKIAGQGNFTTPPSVRGETIEHVGFADVDKRRELLSKAKGLFIPTIYIEPFGGVAIEAMLSGTPVICSDWGVFNETVLHGLTGYRCRTLEQFVWAAQHIDNISPKTCYDWAINNFTIDRIGKMYQEYFEMLSTLWEKSGWYKENPNRTELSWLNKQYPQKEPMSFGEKIMLPDIKVSKTINPLENEPDYSLDLTWYEKEKRPGISFILRAKNEEATVGLALDSLNQLDFPYEVNVVLNQCNDGTEEIVDSCKSNININLYNYPFQLGKTGIENRCTPVNSIHSTIWLLNWILMKGRYQYTFRWDADFIMTSTLASELKVAVNNGSHSVYNISAMFSDSGKSNTEPYLWNNNLNPRYVRYSLWHLAKFGKKYDVPKDLVGKIIHDSPLNNMKGYWDSTPWWYDENKSDILEIAESAKNKYTDIINKLDPELVYTARASCPDSDKLAVAIHKLIGADASEIPEIEKYISELQ